MAEQPATTMTTRVEFDFESYVYLADKGPMTACGLAGDDPDKVWFQTLRILALRKGYSCFSGMPGYYLVNNHGKEEDQSALAHSLPAILHPVDEGSPALFGLRWMIGENGIIYAMCIPTDLKQKTCSDGVDKWLTEKDVVPRRLSLFKFIEPIENKDGHPLAKKFDVWIKDHSDHFGDLKIKSLAATRGWLSHNSFSRNFTVVCRNAEAAIRTEVRKATGAGDSSTQGTKKRIQSAKAVDPTTTAEINRRCARLDLAMKPLQLYMETINVPLGHRIVELNLGEKEGDVSIEELEKLVNIASPPKAAALIELLKASDKVMLLTQGTASISDHYSPFPSPSKPVAPPVPTDNANPDEFVIHHNEAAELRKRGEILESKRKRNPPDSLSPDPPATKGKGAGSSKAPILLGESSAPAPGDRKKRQYNKTGIYSQDPIVAAAARFAFRTSEPSESSGMLSKPLRLPYASCMHATYQLHAHVGVSLRRV